MKEVYVGYDVEVPDEWWKSFMAVKNARGDIDQSGRAPDPDIEKRIGNLALLLEYLYHDVAEKAGLIKQIEEQGGIAQWNIKGR